MSSTLLDSIHRTLFFTDIADGALKPVPRQERPAATSLTGAISNLGSDLQRTFFFNDLKSVASGHLASEKEEEWNEELSLDKKVLFDLDDDTATIDSDELSQLSGSVAETAMDEAVMRVTTFIDEFINGNDQTMDLVNKWLKESAAEKGFVKKLNAMQMTKFMDGIIGRKDQSFDQMTKLLKESASEKEFVEKMASMRMSLFMDGITDGKSQTLDLMHKWLEESRDEAEFFEKINKLLNGSAKTHSEVMDTVATWMEHAERNLAGFAYEVQDLAAFTKQEIEDSELGEFIIDGVKSVVRYPANVSGLQDYEFAAKNAEMQETRRKSLFRKNFNWLRKAEKKVPQVDDEETAVELEACKKIKGPPSLKRVQEENLKLLLAKKEAQLRAAYDISCNEKQAKILESYTKAYRLMVEKTSEYDDLVLEAQPLRKYHY